MLKRVDECIIRLHNGTSIWLFEEIFFKGTFPPKLYLVLGKLHSILLHASPNHVLQFSVLDQSVAYIPRYFFL